MRISDWSSDVCSSDLLLFEAQKIHRANHPRNEVQLSTLLSIKTGGCPEDCGYCNQSASADSGLKAEKLMDVDEVLASAREAKENGSGDRKSTRLNSSH